MQMRLKSKLNSNTFGSRVLLTTGTNILFGLLSLATGSLAARLLGVDGRGELAAIQTTPFFIASIAQLGLPEALVYFSAREPARSGRYFSTATLTVLLASLFFVALGYFITPLVLARQSAEIVSTTRWYLVVMVPLWTLVGMALNVFRGRSSLMLWNGARLIPLLSWLLVLIVAYARNEKDARIVAMGYLAAWAFSSVVLLIFVFRKIPPPFKFEKLEIKGMLKFGLPAMASTAPQLLNLRLDQILMAALLPAEALGLYVVAVAWGGIVSPVLQALGYVSFPRVASLPTLHEKKIAFTQGSRLGVLIALAVALVLSLLTPWLLPMVFGAAFRPAVLPSLVLIVAVAIAGLNTILEEGLRGLGHPKVVMFSELAGLVVTGMALLLLLRSMGIMGAAIASLCGYSTVTLFLIFQIRRVLHCSISELLIPKLDEIMSVRAKVRKTVLRPST